MGKMSALYPFLSGIFPIIFLYSKNISEVPIVKLLKYLISYVLIFGALYSGIFAFLGNYDKTSFVIFISILFFYNSRKIIEKITVNRFGTKILNLFFIVGIFSPTFFMKYIPLGIIGKIVLAISAFITFVPSLQILSFVAKVKKDETETPDLILPKESDKNLPDVYYIVPDSYNGAESLKKYMNFDNSSFLNFLKDKGFRVFDDATSNYPLTNLSLPSTLNLDYIENFCELDKNNRDDQNRALLATPHFSNFVVKYLKEKGYLYYHIVNYWEKQFFARGLKADVEINLSASNDFDRVFFDPTMIGAVSNAIITKLGAKGVQKIIDVLETIADRKGPKFVFNHLICPHYPYYFDETGARPSKNLDKKNLEDEKILYLGQLKYLNTRLESVINNILSHNKNSIIIIQADHGTGFQLDRINWQNPDSDCFRERFNILRAVYVPDGLLKGNFKSSVNVFRAIFNQCFGENFELLEDKSFYSNYEGMFDLKEVKKEETVV